MDKKENTLLIDTDVLVNFFDVKKQFYKIASDGIDFFKKENIIPCVSIVTAIEMIQGNKSMPERKRISKELDPFVEIGISETIGFIARDLIFKYSASHGLILGDALIAATAMHFDTPLFTFNKKDFRFITNLKIYEPSL